MNSIYRTEEMSLTPSMGFRAMLEGLSEEIDTVEGCHGF